MEQLYCSWNLCIEQSPVFIMLNFWHELGPLKPREVVPEQDLSAIFLIADAPRLQFEDLLGLRSCAFNIRLQANFACQMVGFP